MMKVKGIFAVSLIAMMVVGGAYAEIASSGYVDEKIDGLATVAKTGSFNDLANKPTIPAAYVLKAATTDALGGVKSGGDITVATSGAVTVSHATKADTATSATSAASATKATQDASGNVITSTYATKTEVGSKLSSISGSTGGTGNVVTSVSASGSTVSATKGITAEETKNKVTSVRAAASATDTAYPSEKAVATALAAKADKSELSGYATNTRVDAVEDKAEAAQTAASTAQTAANSKLATATYNSQVGTVSATNMGTSASTVVGAIKEVAGEAAAAQTAATNAQNAVNNLDVSTASGSGNVVTSVTQENGKIAVTKGNVQIPVGSPTATSYATIWVQ